MKPTASVVISAVLCAALAQPAFAKKERDRDDDDGDRGRGRGRAPMTKFENNSEHYKYQYRDGRCRYKYEYKYQSGKTKVDQKGDCSAIAFARPAVHREVLPRAIPPEPGMARIECNREVIGAVLGGAVGAVIGSGVGDRRDRPLATAGGAVIGAVIGGAIGRDMDAADQACAAQALEYARLDQTVQWKSPRGIAYAVTPLGIIPGEKGRECRRYIVRAAAGAHQEHTACREDDGSWAMRR